MAVKVLGQSAPAAATNTVLYTVPALKSTVCSTLVVCNRGATADVYRIAIRPAGAALANQHYNAYDVSLPANATDYITVGFTLATTDVITVRAGTANLSFSLYGDES